MYFWRAAAERAVRFNTFCGPFWGNFLTLNSQSWVVTNMKFGEEISQSLAIQCSFCISYTLLHSETRMIVIKN